MGRPAHSPELYDELQKKVFLGILEEIYDELPEWVYERVYEKEDFYYWMEKVFGSKVALEICQQAEADYWSGLIRTAMTRKEEERGEEEIN